MIATPTIPQGDPLAPLRELRDIVHRLRQTRDEAHRQWNTAHEAAMLTLARLQGRLSACKADAEAAETALREDALALHRQSGEKKLIPGVSIRVLEKLTYDEEIAKGWAISHAISGALKLDLAGFKKVAKASPGDVPFVTFGEDPQVTIATDLGAAIAAEEQRNAEPEG